MLRRLTGEFWGKTISIFNEMLVDDERRKVECICMHAYLQTQPLCISYACIYNSTNVYTHIRWTIFYLKQIFVYDLCLRFFLYCLNMTRMAEKLSLLRIFSVLVITIKWCIYAKIYDWKIFLFLLTKMWICTWFPSFCYFFFVFLPPSLTFFCCECFLHAWMLRIYGTFTLRTSFSSRSTAFSVTEF